MRQQRVFKTSKAEGLSVAAVSSVFVLLGLFFMDKHPLASWVLVLIMGLVTLGGLALFFTKDASLCLDEQGFDVVGIFNRKRFLWKDIASIRLAKLQGAYIIALEFKNDSPQRSQLSRIVAGMDANIGNIYEESLEVIYVALTQWHERYANAT